MADLKFKILYYTASPHVSTIDKRFLITDHRTYQFVTRMTQEEWQNPHMVQLLGIRQNGISLSAVLDNNNVLVVKNNGYHPLFVLDETNSLIPFNEAKIPNDSKLVAQTMAVNTSDDKAKIFKIIFDHQESGVKVTLE